MGEMKMPARSLDFKAEAVPDPSLEAEVRKVDLGLAENSLNGWFNMLSLLAQVNWDKVRSGEALAETLELAFGVWEGMVGIPMALGGTLQKLQKAGAPPEERRAWEALLTRFMDMHKERDGTYSFSAMRDFMRTARDAMAALARRLKAGEPGPPGAPPVA
jgi:hypothetical protein